MSRKVPSHPYWRWLRKMETVPKDGKALWYDEDPAGTTFKMRHYAGSLYIVDLEKLIELHDYRRLHQQKEWPSSGHGLCGIVVPDIEASREAMRLVD